MAIRGRIIGFDEETLEITVQVSETEEAVVVSIEDRSKEFSILNPPRLGEEVLLSFGHGEENARKPSDIMFIERVSPRHP